jgi:Flp pilus assembly protein TadB
MKRKFNTSLYLCLFITTLSFIGNLTAATSQTKSTVVEQKTSTSSNILSKTNKIKQLVIKQANILKRAFKKFTKYISKTEKTSEYGIGIFLITMIIFGVALALLGLFAEMWWLLIVIGLLFLLMF